jgi:hypothetical protein
VGSLAALIGEEFALLVTFRGSGEPVPTPLWFGLRDGRPYVERRADAGQVKQLGHDRRVRVIACTVRGKPTASFADGRGGILGAAEENNAELERAGRSAALRPAWAATAPLSSVQARICGAGSGVVGSVPAVVR